MKAPSRFWTSLAEEVSREVDVPAEHIAFMRHSTNRVQKLLKLGGSVEEYTALQPIGTQYDLHDPRHPRVQLVVAILMDRVYGVFRVPAEAKLGTTHSLASEPHRHFDAHYGYEARPARRFHLVRVASRTDSRPISGWERRRAQTAVQRHSSSFFRDILVDVQEEALAPTWEDVQSEVAEDEALAAAPVTERVALVAARIGQGRFREDLLARWEWQCAVTGCDVGVVLRASHCKPWSVSSNQERLDPNNGLPLIATLDALFDRRLISFDDAGRMLVSPRLPVSQRLLLGIGASSRLRKRPTLAQREFLHYHRESLYLAR